METDLKKARPSIALTVGFFDGVHLGHKALFKRLKSLGHAVCVTFENHPSEILRPNEIPPLITPHKERLALIETHVDTLLPLPFSKDLASLSAKAFIEFIRSHIPFSHLLLGYDGRLGKGREGTPEVLHAIGKEEGFIVEYLQPLGETLPISSGRIREAIRSGNLDEANQFLGYPYTFTNKVMRGPQKGAAIGFPTANLDPGLQVIPPFGVYAVKAFTEGKAFDGVANLGVAPTLHRDRKPLLEVHLFDCDEEIYGKELAVQLHTFIREEKIFDSVETLKKQIAFDIQQAKQQLACE